MRSVLIVRLSAIGDVIHALPVLEALRAQLPDARIGWLVEELSAPLLQSHPDLNQLYVIPKKRWRGHFREHFGGEILPFYKQIRGDGWDATLDLQGLLKSSFSARTTGAKVRVGFAGAGAREGSWLLNNRRVASRPQDVHVVEKNLRLLEGLGLKVPEVAPRGTLGIQSTEQEVMKGMLRWAGWKGEGLLAINPGAGWSSKRWPPAYFADLATRLARRTGLRPVVLWGPKEEPMRDEILAGLKDVDGIAAPPTKVRELAVLISLCKMFVGGDTGPTHMAGLLGVPVISIFGASDGARNCPWPKSGPTAAGVVVQRTDLPCEPCWKTVCPLTGDANLACLRGLTPANVYTEVEPWLDRTFPSAS